MFAPAVSENDLSVISYGKSTFHSAEIQPHSLQREGKLSPGSRSSVTPPFCKWYTDIVLAATVNKFKTEDQKVDW